MRKIVYLVIAALLLLPLVACTGAPSPTPSSPDLQITSLVSSIGSADGSMDVQLYSYIFTLQNEGSQEFRIQWIEPVLSDAFASIVLDSDLKIVVDKTLAAGNYLTIEGQFKMDTRGLSKEDIVKITDLQPENIQISAIVVLDLPGHKTR